MDSDQDEVVFETQMRHLVTKHYQIKREEKAAAEAAERNARARRQFLLFLLFAILATSVMFREEINTATLALYEKTFPMPLTDLRQYAGNRTMQNINEDARERLATLNEIEEGLGEDATIREEEATTAKAAKSLRAAKRRQAMVREIDQSSE